MGSPHMLNAFLQIIPIIPNATIYVLVLRLILAFLSLYSSLLTKKVDSLALSPNKKNLAFKNKKQKNMSFMQLVVFDLDYTIWEPEMYQIDGPPKLSDYDTLFNQDCFQTKKKKKKNNKNRYRPNACT